jgi:hypothetical protein
MIYMQLTQNYKDYNRVRILDINFSKPGVSERLNFRYEICKKVGEDYVGLFDKTIVIDEQAEIDALAEIVPDGSLPLWDMVCELLLQYLVDNSIEIGTIETE